MTHDDVQLRKQTAMPIDETIRSFVVDSYLTQEQAVTFRNDDDLLRLLDSLQVLRMVVEFERRFGIQVDNSELTPENLGTVNKLAAFVAGKQRAAAGAE